MDIDYAISDDLLVLSTETAYNLSGAERVRFRVMYKGEPCVVDMSPDDEASDVSILEFAGTPGWFSDAVPLIKTTHRDQFQAWFTQHKAQ